MCPDIELLSAYYDDELDPVWDRQIAEHVAACSSCSERLTVFSRLSDDLQELETPDFEASQARSWEVVQNARRARPITIWNRKVAIPLPAFAAVAALLVAAVGAGVFFTMGRGSQQSVTPPVAAAATPSDIAPVDFQVNNLTDLMNYLDSKDFGNNVTIQLPKQMDQLSIGKPQLIRAADFKRGQ
jgi:anti-sigma factor RsiW